MKVVLYGASGRAGSRILQELLSRGHQVVAITRDAADATAQPGVTSAVDDLSDVAHTAEVVKGADAVVSAYAPPQGDTDQLVGVTQRLVEAIARSGAPRFVMVGGAGTLEVAPGLTLTDSGKLPPEWLPIAQSHGRAFDLLRASPIGWTYLCPAAYFDPGERTGKFRLGTDNLVVDEQGNSRISMEDYAIALVDELEAPRHIRQRFSVGY
jgi:putative NADH-flavin reductase